MWALVLLKTIMPAYQFLRRVRPPTPAAAHALSNSGCGSQSSTPPHLSDPQLHNDGFLYHWLCQGLRWINKKIRLFENDLVDILGQILSCCYCVTLLHCYIAFVCYHNCFTPCEKDLLDILGQITLYYYIVLVYHICFTVREKDFLHIRGHILLYCYIFILYLFLIATL